MKGIKADAPTATATTERKPRKERVRRIQHVTTAVAAQSLKVTVALLEEDYLEVRTIKRKTDLMNFLCQHEDAVRVLQQRLGLR